jgi:hypothetical protein
MDLLDTFFSNLLTNLSFSFSLGFGTIRFAVAGNFTSFEFSLCFGTMLRLLLIDFLAFAVALSLSL